MPKPNIEIEIVTVRKIIDVVPGMIRGSLSRIEVDVCTKCAAIVFDPVLHDLWHRAHEAPQITAALAADAEGEARG